MPGGKLLADLVMYDARDLTTHAVCVGMTGSGKTGLCIDVLEEAAIDEVPALIIDVKGDMTNLLLTFPDLLPRDFRPWVNPDDGRRRGMDLEGYARHQADFWRSGLEKWGQDANRVRTLTDSVDRVIYTPGSQAGVPISILQSFAPPPLSWEEDAELLRERIQGIVGGLLGLLEIDADPVRSRESILLASIFEHAWRENRSLDLAALINAIQHPQVRKMGVVDVDTFFPSKERFELAMALNNIIASPSFRSWLQGEPLDIAGFLATPEGKPRHSIFYIAHLSESERMFFVTMLLNQLVTWVRTQPGTTSLRALLYMDEIFGFFPPVARPPSKPPMLTLLKQARAYGVGVMLATQNPMDLDYKGLTNAGTWFIGRLQTDRDKQRVLDGLEGADSAQEMSRGDLSALISDLGKRVFLMHNVHEAEPVTFQTRWALSYLRGPITRSQIRELVGNREGASGSRGGDPKTPPVQPGSDSAKFLSSPPVLGRGMQHSFFPLTLSFGAVEDSLEQRLGRHLIKDRRLTYAPYVAGMGTVHFVNRRRNIAESEEFALLAEPPLGKQSVDWDRALDVVQDAGDLSGQAESGSAFLDLPASANDMGELKAFGNELEEYLYRSRKMPLYYHPKLKVYSGPGEARREFQMRLGQLLREKRDAEVDRVESRYEKRLDRLQDRLRRSTITLEKKEETASARKREVLVSVGETVLAMFLGRRSRSAASSALGRYRMSSTAGKSAEEAEQSVRALQREMAQLQAELTEEVGKIEALWEQAGESLEEKALVPRKSDIDVAFFGLVWGPTWQIEYEDGRGVAATTSVLAIKER